MPGQFRLRGVTMRDCLKSRTGYDRVLMAVAASFLTVSATAALAQTGSAPNSAAELAIDAAVPRPEPANVPPPTVNDFKPDALAPEAAKITEKTPEIKPSDVATTPPADSGRNDAAIATAPPATVAAPAAEPAKDPVKEPVKAASS